MHIGNHFNHAEEVAIELHEEPALCDSLHLVLSEDSLSPSPAPISGDTLILDNDITFSYCDSELDTDAGVNLTYMLLDDSIFDTTLS